MWINSAIPSFLLVIVFITYFFSLREWDGDLRKLPNIKMKKLSARDAACSHPEVTDAEAKEDLNEGEEVGPEEHQLIQELN